MSLLILVLDRAQNKNKQVQNYQNKRRIERWVRERKRNKTRNKNSKIWEEINAIKENQPSKQLKRKFTPKKIILK